jgi:hypothetical protein
VEAIDGEAIDGEAIDGEAIDGEAMDGEAMEAIDGEAMGGEAMDGEAMDGEASVMAAPYFIGRASDGRVSFPPLGAGVSGMSDGGRTRCPFGGHRKPFPALIRDVTIVVRHCAPPLLSSPARWSSRCARSYLPYSRLASPRLAARRARRSRLRPVVAAAVVVVVAAAGSSVTPA